MFDAAYILLLVLGPGALSVLVIALIYCALMSGDPKIDRL
jgi:hypothetical protein